MNDVHALAVGAHQIVRIAEAGRDLVRDERRDRHRAEQVLPAQLPHQRLHVAAAQVLHRQEVVAADISEVEDLNDVRVAEQRVDARFLHEHVDEIGGVRSLRQDPLDDEGLPETLRAGHDGAEHLGHASAADPV